MVVVLSVVVWEVLQRFKKLNIVVKIIEVARFVNALKRLNEGISLAELRKKIIKGDVKASSDETEWYNDEENKKSLLTTIGNVVGPNADKELNLKLRSLDTDDYYKKGVIKPKSLRNDLRHKILTLKAREDYNNSGITLEDQYEKIKIGNGLELYSVYTPKANVYLSFNILKSNQVPTWCIASPSTSNKFWGEYNLWKSEYPAVFIIVKHGKTMIKKRDKDGSFVLDEKGKNVMEEVTNLKYEIRLNIDEIESFLENYVSLNDVIAEIRDAHQHEREYTESSFYDYMDLTESDFDSAMRKLLTSKKAHSFSKLFGKNSYETIYSEVKSEDDETRQMALLKACQMGWLNQVWRDVKDNEVDFIIDNLITYGTLNEDSLMLFDKKYSSSTLEKAIKFCIKGKRCTNYILELCIGYNKLQFVKDVFYSIPKKNYSWYTLEHLIKSDEKECIDYLIDILANEKDGHEICLGLLKQKQRYFERYLDILLKNKNCPTNILTTVVENASDIYIKKVLDVLIKDGNYGAGVFRTLYKNNKVKLAHYVAKESMKDYGLATYELEVFLDCNDDEMIKLAVKSIIINGYGNTDTMKVLIENGRKEMADEVFDSILKGKVSIGTIMAYAHFEDKSYFERMVNKVLDVAPDTVDEYYLYFPLRNSKETRDIIMKCLIEHEWKPLILLKIIMNHGLYDYLKPCVEILKKKDMINDTAKELLASRDKLDILEEI